MTVKKTRSKFESDTVKKLKEAGIKFGYESIKIKYRLPDKSYTPDIILENGIIIELKGYFRATDRVLHKAIKAQHPKLDIRFVFMSSKNKIHKSSSTTYGDWCKAHGFKFADKEIPIEWVKEKKK